MHSIIVNWRKHAYMQIYNDITLLHGEGLEDEPASRIIS